MNLDRLNSLPSHIACRAAFAALDSIQGLPTEERMAGVAMLFTEFCRGCDLDPSQLINQAQRRADAMLLTEGVTQHTEMSALRAYVKGEMA